MTRTGPRTAIVTGASRGIGLEAARALLARGWQVAITARGAPALMAAANDLGGTGVLPVACDMGDPAAVRAMVARVEAELGPVTGLINNAGVLEPIGAIAETDPAAWMGLLRTNLGGPLHGAQAVLPGMVARGEGVIVNISSGAARGAIPGWSAYNASKAALLMFTQSLHAEYGGRGIRAYSFVPGAVRTSLLMDGKDAFDNYVAGLDPADLLTPDLPGRCLAWILDSAPADRGGQELSIRDPDLRAKVGLPEGYKW